MDLKDALMSIEKVYDRVAKHYNQELSAEVLHKANNAGFDLLTKQKKEINSILALGVGDGVYTKPYAKAYQSAEIAGVDISAKMLKAAQQRLNCQTFHGDISKVSTLIGSKSFDLALAHFICAYVEPEVILSQAYNCLNDNGLVSFVSNTMHSFPHLMRVYNQYIDKQTFIAKTLSKHIDSTLTDVFVPNSLQELTQKISNGGFDVLDKRHMTIDITFSSMDDFTAFFIHGGWFASGLLHSKIHPYLISCLFKVLVKSKLNFPFTDSLDIAICLAQKK